MIHGIERLILWPRDPSKSPRTLEFKLGAVNVVSGYSRTGKSAILSIADFALLSSECNIPSLIRRTTACVGLQLRTSEGVLVLARSVPNDAMIARDDEKERVYWQTAATAEVPDVPNVVGTLKSGKEMLNRLVGLPDVPFKPAEPGETEGFGARPGFRDLMAFNFQTQSLVANANVLFYKADTFKHRERLRHILPLVLGLTTVDRLSASFRLAGLVREQARLQARVQLQNQERDKLRERLQSLSTRLVEVGVLRNTDIGAEELDARTLSQLILVATDHFKSTGQLAPAVNTNEVAKEIAQEQRRHEMLARELADARRRLHLFERMATAASEYAASQRVNAKYMDSLPWMQQKTPDAATCPMCGNPSDAVGEHIQEMTTLLAEVSRLGTGAGQVRESARKDLEVQRAHVLRLESTLTDVRENLRLLEEPLQQNPQSFRAIGILVGESEFVARQVSSEAKSADQSRLDAIDQEISEVRKQLQGSDSGLRDRVLNGMAAKITHYAGLMQVERADAGATIDIGELMVQVGTGENAEYLPQIGSGANWMGYHVSAMLGLHEQLLSGRKASAVPSFLFFDQPSQVYFPADPLLEKSGDTVEERLKRAADDDLLGVRRVFQAMTEATLRTKNALQIIVTEHAGPRVWTGLPVHQVADWHDGVTKLIPGDWIPE